MFQQLRPRISKSLDRAARLSRPWLVQAAARGSAFARGPLKATVRTGLQTLAALLLLFLEWGWQPLANALSRLSKYLVFARLEAWIAGLPPYGALALFGAPALCLLPVKLFAVYLFATGHPAIGVGIIIAAKVVGTAVVARIFVLTQPKLMQIGWFKAAYERFIPWKERIFAEIRSSAAWRAGRVVRVDVKRWLNRAWIAVRPQRQWVAARTAELRLAIGGFLAGLHNDLG